MKGKIFKESENLYQDQATILFDFFHQKAEKIVAEEERLEGLIEKNEGIVHDLEVMAKKYNTYQTISFILFFTVIGLIFGFVYMNKIKQIRAQIEDHNIKIAEFNKLKDEIFRDYKVNKLGVVYVPVASQIGFENKSFQIDHTETVSKEEFKLQIPRQEQLLTTKINELEELSQTAPIVENSEEPEVIDTDQYSLSIQQVTYHDYFGKLDRNLRTSSFCLRDMETVAVSLPVVDPQSDYANDLKEFATTDVQGAPVIPVFDTQQYDEDVNKFNTLNKLRNSLSNETEQFEDTLRRLMVNMANSVQTVTTMKVASSNKLIEESNKLLFKILKAPYNHYSPILEAEELSRIREESFNYSDSVERYSPFNLKQSSRVKYDIYADTWVAEDGSRTNQPFGITQIQEEIIVPIIQNLMQETRIERMHIYNDIQNQKIDYLNQWHRDTEDFYARNRAESADLRNLMSSNLRDFIAATNTLSSLEKTISDMEQSRSLEATVVSTNDNAAEVITAYTQQQEQFEQVQREFDEYMDRLKEDITDRAQVFGYVEYYDASLRDRNPKEISEAATRIKELEERRKPLATVNPLYAFKSEIPPQPNIEDLTYEHMSINLRSIANSALDELQQEENSYLADSQAEILSDLILEQVPEEEEIPDTEVMVETLTDDLNEEPDTDEFDEAKSDDKDENEEYEDENDSDEDDEEDEDYEEDESDYEDDDEDDENEDTDNSDEEETPPAPPTPPVPPLPPVPPIPGASENNNVNSK